MHTELVTILDRISKIDGAISIVQLSDRRIAALARKVVWRYNDRRDHDAVVRFGDRDFRPRDAKDGVVIDTGSAEHDFEIKAILLLLLHIGRKEGASVYKWHTVSHRIRCLVRFARYCQRRDQRSFRNLDSLPSLRLRTLMLSFLVDDVDDGGLGASKFTSAFKSARAALKHLADYGLVRRPDFMQMLDELSLGAIDEHETNHRLKHSIIPTGLMKRLIDEAVSYVSQAREAFSEFQDIFRQTHAAIERSQCSNSRHAIWANGRAQTPRLGELIKTRFRHLQRHVYALVLAFTGMRDDEAGSLQTGCSGHRTESGEEIYFVRSLLSKTDDNAISLDWIANDVAHNAVTLLSSVNELYYERAELLLSQYGDTMTPQFINKMKHGLADRRLFGVRLTVATTTFMNLTSGADCIKALSLDQYQFEVLQKDIDQLEEMECNYVSVSASSGNRGRPYAVGERFNFTAHQFRHTFAWFIIANRLGDLDDIRYQFKHLHRAMAMVYSERGFKALNELRTVIEQFEQLANSKAIQDIVTSAVSGRIAGGGGERLVRLLEVMNEGQTPATFSEDHQPHFASVQELVAFATRHTQSIRGLSNGYCTKGEACKIRNAADPSHCLYCDTYYATPKHAPHWRAIKVNCESRLRKIDAMPEHLQARFEAFRQSLDDNLFSANKVLHQLEGGAAAAHQRDA